MAVLRNAGAELAPFVLVVALFGAVTLQGCGGGDGGGGSGTKTTTVKFVGNTTVTATATRTTMTTTLVPAPEPDGKMPEFSPIRAISYKAMPVKAVPSGGLPAEDFMQSGYEMQWGPKGRDDLGQIKRLGANAVRLYSAIGHEYKTDHGAFLDHAESIGLHVIIGVYTPMLCPDFDCFDTWRDAVKKSANIGFVKNGTWHPAIAMVVIIDTPDTLNFWGKPGHQLNCTTSSLKGDHAKCRVRAALSAMEGFLQAEKELGIHNANRVNLTVSWTFEVQETSIDGAVKKAEGYYGFQDMLAGVDKPDLANYTPKGGSIAHTMMKDAFAKRWTNSLSAGAKWDYIQQKIAPHYDAYAPTPWFLAEWTATDPSASISDDLDAIDATANENEIFNGVTFAEYQHDYVAQSTMGLFALGNKSLGKCKPCYEDVNTQERKCEEFDVYCLYAAGGDNKRAARVAKAWNGTWKGHGMCVTENPQLPTTVVI